MSNETKRDVFEYYLEMIKALKDPLAAETVREARQRYAAALPDDLPVIPKAVGKYIKEAKFEDVTLLEALGCARDPVFKNLGRWITSHSEEFALAWLLGVWRVEETGEIVKAEAEK
ncbi:hypothetical protein LN344_13530 [Lacticaseibacillus paracasei subsp. paracasei]|uniref:hypothetical protein n=1 Tax=Lacticaseibacillus paracasei TaxID=1597 RepID=UPI001E335847|nr:hypothetical protein [Lacticaseibacillus paracasei]MCD0434339.1 hypothetical protein [Lacticaseibacillus paracasei subsp. paracasei]